MREVTTMTRQEIKNLAIELLGFEHEITITIFVIDETCPNDAIAIPLMQANLLNAWGC